MRQRRADRSLRVAVLPSSPLPSERKGSRVDRPYKAFSTKRLSGPHARPGRSPATFIRVHRVRTAHAITGENASPSDTRPLSSMDADEAARRLSLQRRSQDLQHLVPCSPSDALLADGSEHPSSTPAAHVPLLQPLRGLYRPVNPASNTAGRRPLCTLSTGLHPNGHWAACQVRPIRAAIA